MQKANVFAPFGLLLDMKTCLHEHEVTTGGMLSKILENFTSPKNIPNFYPKLLHPVHGIEKN